MPERIPVAAIKDRVSWHWSSGVMPWSAKFNQHGGLWLDLARIETMQALLGEQPMSQPKVKKHSC